MKLKLILCSLFILCGTYIAFAQIPQPCLVPTNANADECTDACVLCSGINGYCSNSNGYTSGTDAGANFCPSSIIENNLYIGFISNVTGNITFNISTSNCQGGPGLHGAIYDKCGSPGSPIICNSNLSADQNWSMSYGNFTAGCVYYIMLEGLSSATDCNFCITTIPSNATVAPAPPAITSITQVPNKGTICPGTLLTFSVPATCNSKIFDWTVTGPGTIVNGQTSNKIQVMADGVGTLKVCVRADNGCKQSPSNGSYFCKDVIIKYPETTKKTVYICCEEPPYFENGNFYDPPCGTEADDVLTYKTVNDCDSMVNLKVVRRPDYLIDLGEIPLCKGEKVNICNVDFSWNNPPDNYQVKCEINPKDAKNFKCDTTKTFQLIHLKINPVISPLAYTFPCPGNKVTIDGTATVVDPLDPVLTTIKYQWQEYIAPTGWQDIAGATAVKYTTDKPGQYRLKVAVELKYKSLNGIIKIKKCEEYSSTSTITKSPIEPPLKPSFSTISKYCNDSTYTFSVNNPDSTLVYKWYSSNAIKDTLIGTTVSFKMKFPTTTICLFAQNSCKSNSPKNCLDIKVLLVPDPPLITGVDSVCTNSDQTYCITNFDSTATYTWKVPTGSTFVKGPGNNCITVKYGNNATSGDIVLQIVNECGVNNTLYPITIIQKPSPAQSIVGNNLVCFNDTVDYQAIPSTNFQYNWTITPPNAGGIIGANGNSNVKIKWLKDAILSVKLSNLCGESSEISINVVVKKLPIAANISGPNLLCENSIADYSIDSIYFGTSYSWIVNGGTILNGQGTKTVKIQWGSSGIKTIEVGATNECGTTLSSPYSVNLLKYPKATINAVGPVCGYTSNLSATPSIGNGVWKIINVPNGENAIINNPTNPNSGVTVSACGSYTFMWTETNQICSDSIISVIKFLDIPKPSNLDEICNPTKTAYTVLFDISGCSPPYKVYDGNTNILLQTINVAPFSFSSPLIPNNTVYKFYIEEANGCKSQIITGQRDCQCITDAGTVSSQILNICEDNPATVVANPDYVSDGNDTYQFVLHDKSGTKLGTIFDINKTGIFTFKPPLVAETTYYISRIAGNKDAVLDTVDRNDKCFQVSTGQPVIWRKYPTVFAGVDRDTCGNSFNLQGQTDYGNPSWKLLTGAGTINFNPNNAVFSSITSSLSGIYSIELQSNNFGCIRKDTIQITFYPTNLSVSPSSPTAVNYNCDSINENFTISFNLSNGNPPYIVDGNPLVGSTFTSKSYPNHTIDTIYFGDNRNCALIPIQIGYTCPCISNLSSIQLTNNVLCQNDIANFSLTGLVKDPNDVVEYILSDNSNPILNPNSILDRNNSGNFSMLTTMSCGKTYYVTALVGNSNKTNSNQVDFNAECLSSATTNFVFNCNPKAIAGLSDTVCGTNYLLKGQNIGNVGNGVWKQLSGTGTTNFSSITNPVTNIDISNLGNYIYEWKLDNQGCKDSANVQIAFGGNPIVSYQTSIIEDKSGFTVQINLSSGYLPYSIDNKAIVGSTWLSDTITCQIDVPVHLDYLIVDAFGCATYVSITDTCKCKGDAGTLVGQIPFYVCEDKLTSLLAIPIDTTLDKNSTWEFILNDNCGVKNGNIIQRNKLGQFAFDPTKMQLDKQYYISFILGDSIKGGGGQVKLTDVCLDSTSCIAVQFEKNPIVNAGADAKVCGDTYIMKASTTTNDGLWSQLSGIGTAVFDEPTHSNSLVKVDKCGKYIFEWSATNNECTRKDTVELEFSFAPITTLISENCNNIYTGYSVSFDIDACFMPVSVIGMTGGSLSGKSFKSNIIQTDSANYNFIVKDANGCQTTIKGSKDCKCKGTISGNIITDLQNVCVDSLGNGFVKASYTGYSLDANDSYHFILSDNFNNNNLGSIIDQNKTGIFQYKAGMQYDKTYYIVAAIGDSLNNGFVNLTNNPCLIFVAKPVVFTKIPTISVIAPSLVECIKNVQIQGTADVGSGKWILKKISKAGLTASFSPSSTSLNPKITVSDTGTYTFTWQVVNGICTIEKDFDIKFNRNPSQKVLSISSKCNSIDTTYQIIINFNGTAPFNTINNSMKGTFNGNLFTSDPITSGANYNFIIKDSKSCDSVVVKGKELCPCKANAGIAANNLKICSSNDTTINLNDNLIGEDSGGKWTSIPSTIGLNGNLFSTKNIAIGDYTFYYTISNKTSLPPCEGDTASFQLTINQSPVADAGLDNFISCKQNIVNLGGKSTNDASITFDWQSPNGGVVSNSKTAYTTTGVQGTYILTVTNKLSGCYDVDTVVVKEMITKPIVNILKYDPLCYNQDNGKVIAKISAGVPPYSFDFNGLKSIYTKKTDSLVFGFLKEGWYKFSAEDSLGCISADSVYLQYPPLITTSLGQDVTVDLGDSYKLIVEKNIANEDIDTIIWKPVLLDSIQFWTDTVTFYPKESQKYCVTLITKNGCRAEDCVRVVVMKKSPVYIPNVFRPDSDIEKNNRFFINADSKYYDKILNFEIFNRWGDVMYKLDNFEPNDPTLGWDGTFRGKQMDPGVYVYYIKIKRKDGSVEIFKGDVTLVK